MTLAIVPRSTIGVADPGTRARMAPGIAWLLAHYTGSPGYRDPSKDLTYARSVATFGKQAGKPYEYSYLIGLGGTVFEQAGDRLGSHCLNFNTRAYGVLLMLGVGVQPTSAMVDAFRQLRAHLVATGQLARDHHVAPHYRFRDTACPGSTVATGPGAAWGSPTGEGRLGELQPKFLVPWAPPAPPPPQTTTPPPVKEVDDMAKLIKPNDGDNAIFAVNGAEAVWMESRAQIAALQVAGLVSGSAGGGEQLVDRQVLAQLTLVGPVPNYAGLTTPPPRTTAAADFRRQVT